MNFLIQFFDKNPNLIYHLSFFRDTVLFVQLLVLIVYLIIAKKLSTFKFFVILLVVSYFVAFGLSFIINHPRPLTYYFNLNYFSPSFPSKHTMISTLITFIFLDENPILFLVSVMFLSLIVYLSWFSFLHWPFDIVAGFVLALLIFYFFKPLLKA
jgi:membrane-associated phospholipid phosphatase